MKILIIGGMHGNEPLGIKLVKKIKSSPINNVDVIFANENAIKLNCRFEVQDLNRSFPGNIRSKIYEERRAAYLNRICKNYDLVLDFHNTHCPNNNCAFVGESAAQRLFDLACLLGLRKVIIADYDCINKYGDNCISVEISLRSKFMSVDRWYKKIMNLSKLQSIPKSKKTVVKYRFVYRISIEDKQKLKLEKVNLKAFKRMPRKLSKAMGVKGTAYPIFVADKYTPYNYGGILNKI